MKSAAFSKVYIHLVFSPKGRNAQLTLNIEDKVYGYIAQVINNHKHKAYIINGMPDHIHILLGLNSSISISDLVREIKKSSTTFINSNKLTSSQFKWQEGYAVFSYGQSQVQMIYKYILNQKRHHMETKFRKEYQEFLRRFEIPYDEKYLFEFYE
jgi:putative transposase